MKRLLLLSLACLLLAGCVHHESLCGNMVFIFIEGEVRKVEANFRDDRLLHSDVMVRGSMTEWRPGPLWKVQGYFTLAIELEATAPIENVDVAVESGRQGASSYSKIPVFQAESFVGKKQLVLFDVGGDAPDAQIVLLFGKKDDPRRREIEIRDLWNRGQNQPLQGTPAKAPSSSTEPDSRRS